MENTFKNITHYHNHLSEQLNSIESFFTKMIIDLLKDIPQDYKGIWKFESDEAGEMEVSNSFEINNEKWSGVTVDVRLRYIKAIEHDTFCEFCNVNIDILKQGWYDENDDEDAVHYKIIDFPTELIPSNIMAFFEPVANKTDILDEVVSLKNYIYLLRKAQRFEKDSDQMANLIEVAQNELKRKESLIKMFPTDVKKPKIDSIQKI